MAWRIKDDHEQAKKKGRNVASNIDFIGNQSILIEEEFTKLYTSIFDHMNCS